MINAPHAAMSPIRLLNRATISAAVLAAAIFAADIATSSAVDLGALYVVPLLVGTLSGPPRFQWVAAGVASVLTLIGAWVSPKAPWPHIAAMNRIVALAVIWTTAVVLARFRGTWLALRERTKDLADINYALDQSAIVAITDTKGTIKYVNDKFCQISKYSRDELLGQDHRILNSAYHPKEFIRNLWHTIANGRIWRGEIRNRAKDGTIYWVDTTIVPFLDERRKPYQYMAIRYEITDRKRSEELLRDQAALARLGEMAAVVAHEVKNPIAGIRGALQVIGSRMPADSRDRSVIGEIIARLDALNRIVQDLLVFARPRELRNESVDLGSLVTNTAALIRRDPALADVDVRVTGDRSVVRGDTEQLQFVFHNVLLNAAQAMGGTGHVDVAIVRSNDGCRVSISDHGPGMPTEVRAKAFDPFFTTKHRGTGLGLPIARRVVEAHGGTIQIDTPESGGTIVSIALPSR
jgi:PAS domain S-box-containing protein